ncbi:MAG: sugar transferase [Kiritimatiellales bacterium]|nr:sugar transferase [Kiritimatiellales bacterium]
MTSLSSAGKCPECRRLLLEELYEQYCGSSRFTGSFFRRWRFFRKKYGWLLVVGGAKALKRLLDVVLSACGLVVLSPLFLLVATAVKMTDGGPIFYFQKRVGTYGAEFVFPKFRSMRVGADKLRHQINAHNDHGDSITFKMKNDPRVTKVGRIIRRLSIDELPQLWCVLRGDMSLVGPRPALPSEVAEYSLHDRRRLDVKPGLTCFWQVSGRGDIPFQDQVRLDVQYIESQSIWLDLKLLLRTIPAVVFGKGAY